jgi:BlaR1 peptidase M56
MSLMLIVEAAGRSLLMGSIIWLALRLLRVTQVRAQRLAWLLALGGALCMPVLAGLQIGLHVLPAAVAPADVGTVSSAAVEGNSISYLGFGLAVIYCAASALLLLRLLLGVAVALHIRGRATPTGGGMGGLDVRFSDSVAAPVTIGSSVILPKDYTRWTTDRLRIVLSHEGAHVRQRDFLVQLLAGLHCAIFWFTPYSWWLRRRLADLGEALSDHAGVQIADSREKYAEVLLSFARGSAPSLPTAAVAMARTSNLSARIERLLGDEFQRCFADRPRTVLAAALVAAIALGAATAATRVQAAAHGVVSSDEMYGGNEMADLASDAAAAPATPLEPAAPPTPPATTAPTIPAVPSLPATQSAPPAPLVSPAPAAPAAPPAAEVRLLPSREAHAQAMAAHARELAAREMARAQRELARESAREAAELAHEQSQLGVELQRERSELDVELARAQQRMQAAQKQIEIAMRSPEFRSLREQQGRLERQMRELAAQELKLMDQAVQAWKSVSDR